MTLLKKIILVVVVLVYANVFIIYTFYSISNTPFLLMHGCIHNDHMRGEQTPSPWIVAEVLGTVLSLWQGNRLSLTANVLTSVCMRRSDVRTDAWPHTLHRRQRLLALFSFAQCEYCNN